MCTPRSSASGRCSRRLLDHRLLDRAREVAALVDLAVERDRLHQALQVLERGRRDRVLARGHLPRRAGPWRSSGSRSRCRAARGLRLPLAWIERKRSAPFELAIAVRSSSGMNTSVDAGHDAPRRRAPARTSRSSRRATSSTRSFSWSPRAADRSGVVAAVAGVDHDAARGEAELAGEAVRCRRGSRPEARAPRASARGGAATRSLAGGGGAADAAAAVRVGGGGAPPGRRSDAGLMSIGAAGAARGEAASMASTVAWARPGAAPDPACGTAGARRRRACVRSPSALRRARGRARRSRAGSGRPGRRPGGPRRP